MCHNSLDFGLNLRCFFVYDDIVCCKCREMLVKCNRIVMLADLKVRALYQYTESFQKLIIQFKELGDEALADIVIYPFTKKLHRQYRRYTAVGIPSSPTKVHQRGFSHVELMFRLLDLEYREVFEKDEFSQKQQSFITRSEVSRHITLEMAANLSGPILLVDDLLTTGATMLTCYRLLQAQGYYVEALVGAISTKLLEA